MYAALGVGKYQAIGEDCLTLNVTTPKRRRDEPMPVMVFIHGGAYIFGSSATPIYDGAALARKGCVYVSVNYRLGALGCLDLSSLSTREITIEDNLFLRDLVMALRWVRDNISVFGGDPDNVTIFGESAGAQAVATLLAVPAAEGLFHRAIAESPASGMVATPDVAAEYADRFAEVLGVTKKDAAQALMAARPPDLISALDELLRSQTKVLGAFALGPTSGTDYLPTEPIGAMRTGTAHRVPLIIGSNAHEGRLFTRWIKLLPTSESAIERLLSGIEPERRERITSAYPGYPDEAACIRLGGDFVFATAVWQIAEAHSRYAPTYRYRYDYAPRTFNWSGFGATHGTELFAVFDVYRTRFGSLLTAAADAPSARRVSDDVQTRWREFARTGVPGDDWPAYTHSDRAVMVFDRRCRIENDPHAQRREAWQSFSLAPR
jgi:para-nitrobenzyl esterase